MHILCKQKEYKINEPLQKRRLTERNKYPIIVTFIRKSKNVKYICELLFFQMKKRIINAFVMS